MVATAPKCSAQNWSEIFNQKKTQIKYSLNQIAALQLYISYAQKGYQVASAGINTVRDITDGEFSLHQAFVTGLKQVSPVISKDFRVAEIITMQAWILRSFSSFKGENLLSGDQMLYTAQVAAVVISECYQELSELLLVVTAGKVEMNDQERLIRLEEIYLRMLDKSEFTRGFCLELEIMGKQRQSEQQTIKSIRRWYEIN